MVVGTASVSAGGEVGVKVAGIGEGLALGLGTGEAVVSGVAVIVGESTGLLVTDGVGEPDGVAPVGEGSVGVVEPDGVAPMGEGSVGVGEPDGVVPVCEGSVVAVGSGVSSPDSSRRAFSSLVRSASDSPASFSSTSWEGLAEGLVAVAVAGGSETLCIWGWMGEATLGEPTKDEGTEAFVLRMMLHAVCTCVPCWSSTTWSLRAWSSVEPQSPDVLSSRTIPPDSNLTSITLLSVTPTESVRLTAFITLPVSARAPPKLMRTSEPRSTARA